MRSWASLGRNNNITSMVTSCWDSIKHVAPDEDTTATLRHSCRGSGGGGGMDAVTDAAFFWFDLGR